MVREKKRGEEGRERESGSGTNLLSKLTSELSTSELHISTDDNSSVSKDQHSVLLFEKGLDVRKPGVDRRESVVEVGVLRL